MVVADNMRFVIDVASPPEGATYGTPPTFVEANAECAECKGTHDMEVCPDCGADIILGFGLGIAPGFGPWAVCEQFCGWSYKQSLPNDEC